MITPGLPRWIADLLADEDTGVNTWRTTVPRGGSDAAPPEVDVYNAIDDHWVARAAPVEGVTPTRWVLHVNVGLQMQVAGDPDAEGGIADTGTVIVHLSGVTLDANNAAALAAAFRLMRVVRRVLLRGFRAIREQATPLLVLEEMEIGLPQELELLVQESTPGAGTIDMALVIPFDLTDIWALAAPET